MHEIYSPAMVKRLMASHNLQPRKSMGQNFLVDGNILKNLVDSLALQQGDTVFEIGPGLGALTTTLASAGARVVAVEADRYLEPLLRQQIAPFGEQVKLVLDDIMQVDIEQCLIDHCGIVPPGYRVCANIPYHITTPIIFKLLEECPGLKSATLMMQKEVARRITAHPDTKDYGRLTVAVAYHCRVSTVMQVSRNCFYPRPDVDSVVLCFEPYGLERPYPVKQERTFKDFLAYAFQHRRKTILNISTQFFGKDKVEMSGMLSECGLDARLRPENIELKDYVRFVDFVESSKQGPTK